MTSSAATVAKTRTLTPLDFTNSEHRGLLFDLALSNKQNLLNDVDNDIINIIAAYEYRASCGELHAFIVSTEQPVGCFWIEIDRYGIGRVRGALLPAFKKAWDAAFFLKKTIEYGFNFLGLRKLDTEMALYSKHDRESATAERLFKRLGFKKRAILPQSLMIGGKPINTILLDYLQEDFLREQRKR